MTGFVGQVEFYYLSEFKKKRCKCLLIHSVFSKLIRKLVLSVVGFPHTHEKELQKLRVGITYTMKTEHMILSLYKALTISGGNFQRQLQNVPHVSQYTAQPAGACRTRH